MPSAAAPCGVEISVVIPLYNNENEIRRALASALGQNTAAVFEVIVVDDGSTDAGPSVVQSFRDSRVRLHQQANAGVSAARNRGITLARADLIAFLDADDEWEPEFLSTILRLRTSFVNCDVFATSYRLRRADGSGSRPVLRGLPPEPWSGVLESYFDVASASDPPLWSSAVAVTRQAITSVGMFPHGVRVGEDILTWARLALRYEIAYSRGAHSIFNVRDVPGGQPTRWPDPVDQVGSALRALLPEVPPGDRRAFRRYLAMWHRMRASMFLRHGASAEARREAWKIAKHAPVSPHPYLFGGMSFFPAVVSHHVFAAIQTIRSRSGHRA